MNLVEKHTGKFTRNLGWEVEVGRNIKTVGKSTELNMSMRKQVETTRIAFTRTKQASAI